MEQILSQIKDIEQKIKQNYDLLADEKDSQMRDLINIEITELNFQLNYLNKTVATIKGESFESIDDSDNSEDELTENKVNPNIAIMEIRTGTGGEEASLFAHDLYRMYCRFADKSKWILNEDFISESESGGIKTVVFEIKGSNAYNLLKNESGVHRVQRVPETESGGRIHTSASTVAVLPKFKKIDIQVKPEDLAWEFYRAGGKGGQNVNKVSTAVRLTHTPTNTVVECQEERSQGKNREKALNILNSKLYKLMQDQQVKTISELRLEQVGTGDRSEKIRTYNYPQDRITDHRLQKNYHNIPSILNGNIEKILEDCLEILG